MKKLMMALMLCLVSIMCFGIQVNENGSLAKDDIIAKWSPNGTYISKIIFNSNGYNLYVPDVVSPNVISIFLGNSKEEALESLNQLITWFNNVKNKSYIEIVEEGQNITLYKYGGSYIYISYADAVYIQSFINNSIAQSFGGGNMGLNDTRNNLIGWFSIKLIKNGINKLTEN